MPKFIFKRAENWSSNEIDRLVGLWLQNLALICRGKRRKASTNICAGLRKAGFNRTFRQVEMKMTGLKGKYRHIKAALNDNSPPPDWQFYDSIGQIISFVDDPAQHLSGQKEDDDASSVVISSASTSPASSPTRARTIKTDTPPTGSVGQRPETSQNVNTPPDNPQLIERLNELFGLHQRVEKVNTETEKISKTVKNDTLGFRKLVADNIQQSRKFTRQANEVQRRFDHIEALLNSVLSHQQRPILLVQGPPPPNFGPHPPAGLVHYVPPQAHLPSPPVPQFAQSVPSGHLPVPQSFQSALFQTSMSISNGNPNPPNNQFMAEDNVGFFAPGPF